MSRVQTLSADVPRMGNRFTRAIGRLALGLLGWKIQGELPNYRKLIVVLAPHTSNWDFLICMAATLALGIKLSYVMKKEAFKWPLKRLFLAMGGVPVDRQQSGDLVDQMVDWFRASDQAWLAITPEGTRKKVTHWKTGFLRIAGQSEVPVLLMAWDYPNKSLRSVMEFQPSTDHDADMDRVRAIYEHYRGRHPERQTAKLSS